MIWKLKAEGNPRKEYVHGELDNSVSQIQPAKRLFDKGGGGRSPKGN